MIQQSFGKRGNDLRAFWLLVRRAASERSRRSLEFKLSIAKSWAVLSSIKQSWTVLNETRSTSPADRRSSRDNAARHTAVIVRWRLEDSFDLRSSSSTVRCSCRSNWTAPSVRRTGRSNHSSSPCSVSDWAAVWSRWFGYPTGDWTNCRRSGAHRCRLSPTARTADAETERAAFERPDKRCSAEWHRVRFGRVVQLEADRRSVWRRRPRCSSSVRRKKRINFQVLWIGKI